MDFLIHNVIDFLCTIDIVHLSKTSHVLHNQIIDIVEKVLPLPYCIQQRQFYRRIYRRLGDTDVMIPVFADSLYGMRRLVHMETELLLSHVSFFHIMITAAIDSVYRGPYMVANPTVLGVSLLDVCDDCGEWKISTFLHRDGNLLTVRDQWEGNCLSFHYMSPRIAPPFSQTR